MGVRFPSVATTTIINGLLGQNTETLVCTTPPLNLSIDGALILVHWEVTFTVGPGTSGCSVFIRRGATLAGAVVINPQQVAEASSATDMLSGCYTDQPGAVAGQQYTLSLQTTAATGTGVITNACLIALML